MREVFPSNYIIITKGYDKGKIGEIRSIYNKRLTVSLIDSYVIIPLEDIVFYDINLSKIIHPDKDYNALINNLSNLNFSKKRKRDDGEMCNFTKKLNTLDIK